MVKRLLDASEEITYLRLTAICEENQAHVLVKVRLADVLSISTPGLEHDLGRYALQSHFDFVVVNSNYEPLFAVEFDGASHETEKQVARDAKKDTLCEKCHFPLLRINSRYVGRAFRDMDLLNWCVQTWFLNEAFNEAQQAGLVPYDEPFDPMSFLNLPGSKKAFPMWLSLDVAAKIRELSEAGKIVGRVPSHIIGRDGRGTYHALGYLRVTQDEGVCAETGMRAQQFPIIEAEMLGEILVFDVHEALLDVLSGKTKATPLTEIFAKADEYRKLYGECSVLMAG